MDANRHPNPTKSVAGSGPNGPWMCTRALLPARVYLGFAAVRLNPTVAGSHAAMSCVGKRREHSGTFAFGIIVIKGLGSYLFHSQPGTAFLRFRWSVAVTTLRLGQGLYHPCPLPEIDSPLQLYFDCSQYRALHNGEREMAVALRLNNSTHTHRNTVF
ncbi:hypothetical protein LIA77_09597 [Sarocladium implicatum]|nr:hypothetical protein LIA77_09597 [Sarocladium implicatum]